LEERFKGNGVDEVLLLRQKKASIEVLEGLTSNVFVIDRNGTLRTPQEHMLPGCARHLVLNQARALGWQVECGPVTLDRSDQWVEVMCTSAVRLIVPVGRIVIVDDEREQQVVWRAPPDASRWRELFDALLRTAGDYENDISSFFFNA